jgi:hypothetical protein
VGRFSLDLDPTDRPYRPLRLTDSLLGYLLLAFLFAVSLHLFLDVVVPGLRAREGLLLGLDAAAVAVAVMAEQVALVIAGRNARSAMGVSR